MLSVSIVHPATVPDSAFNTPAFVTLNGADANAAAPNHIPSSASAIKISVPDPNVNLLSVVLRIKLVAVNASVLNANPPIFPPAVAVIVPCITTDPSVSKWKLEDDISIFPNAPEIN